MTKKNKNQQNVALVSKPNFVPQTNSLHIVPSTKPLLKPQVSQSCPQQPKLLQPKPQQAKPSASNTPQSLSQQIKSQKAQTQQPKPKKPKPWKPPPQQPKHSQPTSLQVQLPRPNPGSRTCNQPAISEPVSAALTWGNNN
jgi:hypothetical protein